MNGSTIFTTLVPILLIGGLLGITISILVILIRGLIRLKKLKQPTQSLLRAEIVPDETEKTEALVQWTKPFGELDLRGGEMVFIEDNLEDMMEIRWPDGMIMDVGYIEESKTYEIVTVMNDTKEAWAAPLSEITVKDRNELISVLQKEIWRVRS